MDGILRVSVFSTCRWPAKYRLLQ